MKKPEGIHKFVLPVLLPLIIIIFVTLSISRIQSAMPSMPAATGLVLTDYPDAGRGCLATGCHTGIEPIREHHSKMAEAIYKEGKKSGDENGCVVCHMGDPSDGISKEQAHTGMLLHPSSMWVNELTCGKCHKDYTYAMHRNLMQTEAGKIQGALWGWGAQTGYKPVYGNYFIDDPDGKVPIFGSDNYKDYMHKLIGKYPGNFPDSLLQLPEVDMEQLAEHPEQAVFTYIRNDCQRCHLGVKGKRRRGDFRGMGCAACHIPYSDNGFYEGNDNTIDTAVPGHMLVHSIQSSRKAKVTVNDITYSGIPSQQCTSCHNRGKRIGVSFLGMIESPYNTPYDDQTGSQQKLHGKNYAYIGADHHHDKESREGNPEGGLLCQDCHATISMHGNGNIGGTTLGEVEIECYDCHGTPDKFPWQLPLGFGDEFGMDLPGAERGLLQELTEHQKNFSTVHPAEDGYILSARGNPLGDVIRKGNKVIVKSASGLDFEVPVLRDLAEKKQWQNPLKATTAMMQVKDHMEKLECYTCHSNWAPQCYGCHVKVDYSNGKRCADWIKSGSSHGEDGETVESLIDGSTLDQPGSIVQSRSYIRWEDPVLGINGEGRVSPIITGCQQIITVVGPDGEPLVTSKIWRTPPGMENGGEEGQRGIDMSPAQPHTVSRRARECTSCHTNPKALGYGIEDGIFMQGYEEAIYKDITTATGELLSKRATHQFGPIADLDIDLSQVVTRNGKQVQTVGHHWPLSGPLSQDQRTKMERAGVCIACHQDLPDGDAAIALMAKGGEILNMIPHCDNEHSNLLNLDLKWAAWSRIIIIILLIALAYLLNKRYMILGKLFGHSRGNS